MTTPRLPKAPLGDVLSDVLARYGEVLGTYWWAPVGLFAATVATCIAWNRVVVPRLGDDDPAWLRWLGTGLLAAALVGGASFAIAKASLFDDSFISFRYAQNWIDGHGLVFNPGERVEGYTNFLWVVVVGGLGYVTRVDLATIGLIASFVCFLANLVVVYRLSLVLRRSYATGFVFPIAVCLLAAQWTFTSFGTTGMETGAASLLVNLGVLHLIGRDDPKGAGLAGLFFILATLTRPDHGIFYAVGALVIAAFSARPLWEARRDGLGAMWRLRGKHIAAYAAPFALYAAYLVWKVSYYGDLFPNTYYAKSAGDPYWSQGLVYATSFYLGSHFWVMLGVLIAWLAMGSRDDGSRRFRLFAGAAVLLYNLYVLRVGGDFMAGRFYVTLIPLMLLAAEQVVLAVAKRGMEPGERGLRPAGIAVAALVICTACGAPLHRGTRDSWHIVEEGNFYEVDSWFPARVRHSNYHIGHTLGTLRRHGIEPIIATSGVGMIGYYSGLEVIDRVGLTDETVAHLPIAQRGRPGHEKWAPLWYIRERGAHFVRGGEFPPELVKLNLIRLGKGAGRRRWRIHRYDRDMMRRIREVDPHIQFLDFERWLDDYIALFPRTNPAQVAVDFAWIRPYYFDNSDDPERLERFERKIRGED